MRVFGTRGDEPGEFRDIEAMHIDLKGNLYICESNHNRVQVFSGIKPNDLNDQIACLGLEEVTIDSPLPKAVLSSNILEPCGIAEGKNGEIVVTSPVDNRVSVFDCDHKFIMQFGSLGHLDGCFNKPSDIAVTSDNYILVSSRDKLQWFTMLGQLVYATGSEGKKELEFNHPDCIALGRDEKIYVLEKQNKRVQILNGDATYYSSFEFEKGVFPEALAINSEGNIFLADTRNGSILIYSSKGKCLSTFCVRDHKKPNLPTAIAIDIQDNVFIGSAIGIVTVFDKEGLFMLAFRGSHTSGHFNVIKGLHVSKRGHIYVCDCSNNQINVFRHTEKADPNFVDHSNPISLPVLPHKPVYTVGPIGPISISSLPVKILHGIPEPSAVAIDSHGNIYVASYRERKILIYNSVNTEACSQISEVKNPMDPGKEDIADPSGLAFVGDGCLLVSFWNHLVKMDLDGMALADVKSDMGYGIRNEEGVCIPGGVAVGKDGKIFLVDRRNHRIQIFHSNFTYFGSLFNPDDENRSCEDLESVALNSAGDLYVTDSRNCNVQVYNRNGAFMFAFGTECSKSYYKRGGLSSPHAIATEKEDFVFVGDRDGVVSIFAKNGEFVRSFGGSGDQPGKFGDIRGMQFDSHGHLYVCEWETNRVQVFQKE